MRPELLGCHSRQAQAQMLGHVNRAWTRQTPLRTERVRRSALVELDALVAVWLGIAIEDLLSMYNSRFPFSVNTNPPCGSIQSDVGLRETTMPGAFISQMMRMRSWWNCACRECRPCSSGRMLVLAKDAAQVVTPVDVQPGELIRVGDWFG